MTNLIPSTPEAEVSTGEPLSPISSSPQDILTQIRAEREANDKAIAEVKKLLSEQQELHIKMALGGRAMAGTPTPKEKTIEDIAQERADAVIKKHWRG